MTKKKIMKIRNKIIYKLVLFNLSFANSKTNPQKNSCSLTPKKKYLMTHFKKKQQINYCLSCLITTILLIMLKILL